MDDTEFFLPSEIARLVYGHFKAMECDDISSKFLNESAHLTECRELQNRNRSFKTEANGLPLKDILDQYLNMNKLILGTVNKLVGDPRKFTDPVEAFNYLLGNGPKEIPSGTNLSVENRDSLDGYSSSSSEDMFSDFSLNLKTPDKHKSREKVTKSKLGVVIELNNKIDRSTQETTPESNKPPSRPPSDVIIRQSTRLQLKKALKNDRSCNSDSIKELRKNPNDDCETPRKVGNPPYSENKLLKPKPSISLMSSDSEPEPTLEPELTAVNTPSSGSSNRTDRLNGLFSPGQHKPLKKKTIKVMRPRRPPSTTVSSVEQVGENEKIKCKRNRVPTSHTSNNPNNDGKKSKLSGDISQLRPDTGDEEKTQRSSEEFIFTTDGPEIADKQKTRRRSGSTIPVNDDRLNPIKSNKSLPMLDDMVLGEKLIKNKKLQEHIAANINELIINSPQKKSNNNESDTVDLDELIKNSIEKIIDDPLYKKFESDVIVDLMFGEDFASAQTSSDVNSVVEFTENDTIAAATAIAEINDQPLLNSQVIVDIEDPLTINNDEVESHNEEQQNPAIIIEIREDQIANQENYVEKPTAVSEELRHYFSNITGQESSPDKFNSAKCDNASVINIISPDGGISETCKISHSTSERILLNNNSVLFPINESIPMVTFTKGSEFQICGTPSSITQASRKKHQYVPIAPKPNIAIQLADQAIGNTERNKVPKRRRTRGGKRP